MFGFAAKTMPNTNDVASKEAPTAPAAAPTVTGVIHKGNETSDSEKSKAMDSTMILTPPHDDPKQVATTPASAAAAVVVDPLDVSLHTTCSDVSIDFDQFLAASKKLEIEENHTIPIISFPVSQMDGSDSKKATSGLTVHPDNEDKETTRPVVPSSVDGLLESDEETKTEQLPANRQATSILVRYKIWVLLALILGAAARGINKSFLSSHVAAPTKFVIVEDETKLMVGDYTFHKETLNPSSPSFGLCLVVLLGLARLALSSKTTTGSIAPMDASDQDNGRETSDDAASSVKSLLEDSTVPSLISINLEEDVAIVSTYDLSHYEALKVVKLRDLLRSRKCSYTGRKTQLVHRLASVYRSELKLMTVVQLRQILKSRDEKQGGLKQELLKRLVESGL